MVVFVYCADSHTDDVVLEHILIIEHFVKRWTNEVVVATILIHISIAGMLSFNTDRCS